MHVRPRESDGLLFWVSEQEMTPYSDYLAIGLHGGFAQVGYNLGSGELLLVCNHSRIDDDRWHTIRVRRSIATSHLSIVRPNVYIKMPRVFFMATDLTVFHNILHSSIDYRRKYVHFSDSLIIFAARCYAY